MSVQRIAARYARSIIELAQEKDNLDRVRDDMEFFLEVCKQRDFELLLKSPIVDASKKKSVFKRVFSDEMDPITMGFINIVLRKGREQYLEEIANEFMHQYREIKRISAVSLTTAVELNPEQLESIRKAIAGSEITYENVELSTKVDPSILGGFVVEFDDKLYDASVEHQLDEARKSFS